MPEGTYGGAKGAENDENLSWAVGCDDGNGEVENESSRGQRQSRGGEGARFRSPVMLMGMNRIIVRSGDNPRYC